MAECYVCAGSDPPILHGLCACTDRFIHARCQKRLIETIEFDARCSVCKTRYRNTHVTLRRRVNVRYYLGHLAMGALFSSAILFIAVLARYIAHVLRAMPRQVCLFDVVRGGDGPSPPPLYFFSQNSENMAMYRCVQIRYAAISALLVFACISSFVVVACATTVGLIRRTLRTELPEHVTPEVHYAAVCGDILAPDAACPGEACTEILET